MQKEHEHRHKREPAADTEQRERERHQDSAARTKQQQHRKQARVLRRAQNSARAPCMPSKLTANRTRGHERAAYEGNSQNAPCMPRMAVCGGLMIGVPISEPYTPAQQHCFHAQQTSGLPQVCRRCAMSGRCSSRDSVGQAPQGAQHGSKAGLVAGAKLAGSNGAHSTISKQRR